ncbi:MAG: tRNA pseudouridine(55) synthase TruB [Clostridia bacterium]
MNGVINVLKAPGMTSSNVVYDVRRLFGIKKVGHSGTLDPGAAGVLPILLGKATRLFDYIIDKEKEYIAEIAFGAATDTLDSYGIVLETSDKIISKADFLSVSGDFQGNIEQIAPMYSAIMHNGQKLYKLARAGEIVERKTRFVSVYSIELLDMPRENRFLVRINCSKGTYIRTLADDIGRAIGCPAHISFLLRTKSGMFSVDGAYSIAELSVYKDEGLDLKKLVIPMDTALMYLPEIRREVDDLNFKRLILNGASVEYKKATEKTLYRVYCGEFLGLGKVEGGKLSLTVNLCEGEGL